MNALLGLSRGIDWFTTKLGQGMWWLTLFMVIVGFINVVGRYGFNLFAGLFGNRFAAAISGNVYLELQTYAYDLVFLLGAAYVLRADAHVRVDIIFSNLTARARAAIDIFGTLFFLIPFCVMGIYFSQNYVAQSWRQLEFSPNPGGLPRYPIKTVIIVAFALLILQGISELIKNAAFLRRVPNSGSVHAKEPAGAEPPTGGATDQVEGV